MRLTLADGTVTVVEDPVLRGDSIYGLRKECRWVEGSDRRACGRAPETLPLDRVEAVEVRRVSAAATFGAIVITGAVLWFLYEQTVGKGFTVFKKGL